ncbi:MAG: colanic acid exporter [Methanomassiliicoccales archaeon PtaU1.Bin124]|nr:MAG: colanic acid exporter [Methanomassiliicoccales archaeon PtaU1.Bin124]
MLNKSGSKNKNLIDVLTVMSGTTAAQLIIIISAPLVTRLYGADSFGLSSLFSSIVSILVVVVCLRYEMAIMLPKSDEEAINILILSIIISFIFSLMLVPFILLFESNLIIILNAPGLQNYLWLVPPMVFFTGSFSALSYWIIRRKKFKNLAFAQVAKATATSGTQLSAGYMGYATGGNLIGGSVLGQTFASTILSFQVWKSDKHIIKNFVSRKQMRQCLHHYQNFPLYDVWSGLLNAFSFQMPIFILSIFFSSTVVGFYSLALLVLLLPTSFIGSAIGQIFYQRSSEAYHKNNGEFATIVEATVSQLFLIGFPIILSLVIIGGDAFNIVFGSNWTEAGYFSQVLSIWILVVFVTSPISTIYAIFRKLRILLIINVILFFIRTIVLIIGGIFNDVYLGLTLFSLASSIILIAMGIHILKISKISIRHLCDSVKYYLVLGSFCLVLIFIIRNIFLNNPQMVIILSVVIIMPYYFILLYKYY